MFTVYPIYSNKNKTDLQRAVIKVKEAWERQRQTVGEIVAVTPYPTGRSSYPPVQEHGVLNAKRPRMADEYNRQVHKKKSGHAKSSVRARPSDPFGVKGTRLERIG